jgi:hypothetical protein
MKNKTSSILMGGLGNYMFQVAVAYAYSKRYNKSLGFNCQESSGVHQHVTTYDNNIFKDIDLYCSYALNNRRQFNEDGFHYQEIPDYPNKDILFYGYFQSEKYFKDYEDDLREMFMSYDIEVDEDIQEVLNNKNTCSIHVRRGDYLNLPDHHPTQSMNYYMKAIKKMPKDSVFLIFYDDITWCKENFPDLPEKFRFMEGNKDYEDLYLMSHCKNNIICNSTFSWWGAWLNDNSKKIVVAPNKWFGKACSNWNIDDVYCENWIKV